MLDGETKLKEIKHFVIAKPSLEDSKHSFTVEYEIESEQALYSSAREGAWNHHPNGCASESIWEEGSPAQFLGYETQTHHERSNLAFDLEDGWTGGNVKFQVGEQDVWDIINPSFAGVEWENAEKNVVRTIIHNIGNHFGL
jgi:hypothetical protein